MSFLTRYYHPMWVKVGLIALAVVLSVATGNGIVLAGDDNG